MHLSKAQIIHIFQAPLTRAMSRLFDSWQVDASLSDNHFVFVLNCAFYFPASSLYDDPADKRSRELVKADRGRVKSAVNTVLAALGIDRSWPEDSTAKPGYKDMHFKATFDAGSILLKGSVGITPDDEVAVARMGVRFLLPFELLESYLLSLDNHQLFEALTEADADEAKILRSAAASLEETPSPLPPEKRQLVDGLLQAFDRLRLSLTRSPEDELLNLPLLLRRRDFSQHVEAKHGIFFEEVLEAYFCQTAPGHEELRDNHKRDGWNSDVEVLSPTSGEVLRLPSALVASKTKHLGISERGKLVDLVLEALRGSGTKVIVTAYDLVDMDRHQTEMRGASSEKIKFWGRAGAYRIERGERLRTYPEAEDIVNSESAPKSTGRWAWPGSQRRG